MKIGIMGGTFDPIHNGHLMLGKEACRQFHLDLVWFMPNGRPPHKAWNSIRSDMNTRARMVELAIKDEPAFVLQDYEIKKQTVSYSYETMEHFTSIYPKDQFYFIIGADSLRDIETWKYPERLLSTCTILAAYRDEWNNREVMLDRIAYLNHKYQAHIELLQTPLLQISSHELRQMLQAGDSISEYVPEQVEAFITKEGLYES